LGLDIAHFRLAPLAATQTKIVAAVSGGTSFDAQAPGLVAT
jgi:hypothetical protein